MYLIPNKKENTENAKLLFNVKNAKDRINRIMIQYSNAPFHCHFGSMNMYFVSLIALYNVSDAELVLCFGQWSLVKCFSACESDKIKRQ